MIRRLASSSEVVKEDTRYLGNKAPYSDVSYPTPPLGAITTTEEVINAFADFAIDPQNTFRFIKDCNYMGDPASMRKGGYVALLTNDETMFNNLDTFFKKLKFSTKRIRSKDEMYNAIRKDGYGNTKLNTGISDTVCLGITFDQETAG